MKASSDPPLPALMEILRTSWQRAWDGIGAGAAGGSGLLERLLACYSEPHRKYHTLQHLAECVAVLEPVLDLAAHAGEVEVALWFHDAIYDVKAQDNEMESARWAARSLLEARVPSEVAARVRELVLATRHAALPSTADERLLVDVDLSILGAEPGRFEEYERQVRQEYAWVPGWLFRRKRRAVLKAFLARPQIYGTPHFHTMLEVRGRENLQRAIARLGG